MINNIMLICVILSCALHADAQLKKSLSNFRFQVELGKIYSDFREKPISVDGFGLGTVNHYSNNKFIKQTYINYPFSSSYLGIKCIVNTKHIFMFQGARFASEEWMGQNTYPETGIAGISYSVLSLGYGYLIPLKKIRVIMNGLVSYRKNGTEVYTIGYMGSSTQLSEPLYGYISYTKPWGATVGGEVEFFVTKNFGLGVNLSYSCFPFEHGKIESTPLFNLPQKFELESANRATLNATAKLFFNFEFKKIRH